MNKFFIIGYVIVSVIIGIGVSSYDWYDGVSLKDSIESNGSQWLMEFISVTLFWLPVFAVLAILHLIQKILKR